MTTTLPSQSRRSLISGAIVAVGGVIAGFAYARSTAAAKPRPAGAAANAYGTSSSNTGKVLISVSAVPSGGGKVLDSAGIVVTKDASGAVHAFSSTCTHQGGTVSSVSGGTIHCPCHGSRFDARTGAPVAGPASRPLPAVAGVIRSGQIVTG